MVRIAVIGYGYWGPNLVKTLNQSTECDLAAVCDMDTARLEAVKANYPSVHITASFQEILDDDSIDAVIIATPARTHHALGVQALRAGKHVFTEKPLALSSADCEDLIQVARQENRALMVGHTFMYSPALIKVKEMVDADDMGDIFYLYMQRLNLGRVQTDLNAMWSIAPHDVSIALHLLEKTPVEVSATGSSYLTKGIDDVVFVAMTFPNGAVAHIHVSWLDPRKVRSTTVVGSDRMVVYDDVADEEKVKVYDKSAVKDDGSPIFKLHAGDIFVPRVANTEPLANEIAHFAQCIREGTRPLTDGQAGLDVVRVMEAAQKSMEQHGAPVQLITRAAAA